MELDTFNLTTANPLRGNKHVCSSEVEPYGKSFNHKVIILYSSIHTTFNYNRGAVSQDCRSY